VAPPTQVPSPQNPTVGIQADTSGRAAAEQFARQAAYN
jgi:hypothetical protein